MTNSLLELNIACSNFIDEFPFLNFWPPRTEIKKIDITNCKKIPTINNLRNRYPFIKWKGRIDTDLGNISYLDQCGFSEIRVQCRILSFKITPYLACSNKDCFQVVGKGHDCFGHGKNSTMMRYRGNIKIADIQDSISVDIWDIAGKSLLKIGATEFSMLTEAQQKVHLDSCQRALYNCNIKIKYRGVDVSYVCSLFEEITPQPKLLLTKLLKEFPNIKEEKNPYIKKRKNGNQN